MGLRIYLDIDGVLLDGENPADGADEFLEFVTSTYPGDVYWLSGRCQGDATATVAQIADLFDADTVERISEIHATDWATSKTEAIDFSNDFLWFDDVLDLLDEQLLSNHGVLDRFILIELHEQPDQLRRLTDKFPPSKNSPY